MSKSGAKARQLPDGETPQKADEQQEEALTRNEEDVNEKPYTFSNTETHHDNINHGNSNENNTDIQNDSNNVKPEAHGEQPPLQETPSAREVHSIFSHRFKIFLILMTSFATLFSPFSSFIYLPALTPIAESYHRSLGEINLTVTIYQIMQALAPLFFGDLSDQIGRRPVYMITFALYLGSNIGLALQNNYAALMVLRALQSSGSSATVAIGSAVIADVTTAAERGAYITYSQVGVMFAPALAPVLGGILTQYLGWRSTFWFLTIAAGVFLVLYLPFMPEVSLIFSCLLGNFPFYSTSPAFCCLSPSLSYSLTSGRRLLEKSSAMALFLLRDSTPPSPQLASLPKDVVISKQMAVQRSLLELKPPARCLSQMCGAPS